MKGQHRILNEILIFAFGVAIASFVILSFGNMTNSLESEVVRDQLNNVANVIKNGIVKAHTQNTTVKILLPQTVSDNIYKIILKDNNITIVSYGVEEINITKQLFNMDNDYIIKGEVVSSARYIKINNTAGTIIISRVDRGLY